MSPEDHDFRRTYGDLIREKGCWTQFRWWLAQQGSRFCWWVTPEPMRSQMLAVSRARFGEFKEACDRITAMEKAKQ